MLIKQSKKIHQHTKYIDGFFYHRLNLFKTYDVDQSPHLPNFLARKAKI
jgi:hypothetical protein